MKSESQALPRWAVLLLTVVNLALFFIPALIIQPFKHQSENGLAVAIFVKQIAPMLSLIAGTGVVVFAVRLWRGSRWIMRSGLVAAVVLSAASAVMVRLNYFEWMFRPIQTAGFTAASDIQLSDAEMVMTVREGQEARAYPIREMAYHHILNDTVGAVPIVVTY